MPKRAWSAAAREVQEGNPGAVVTGAPWGRAFQVVRARRKRASRGAWRAWTFHSVVSRSLARAWSAAVSVAGSSLVLGRLVEEAGAALLLVLVRAAKGAVG